MPPVVGSSPVSTNPPTSRSATCWTRAQARPSVEVQNRRSSLGIAEVPAVQVAAIRADRNEPLAVPGHLPRSECPSGCPVPCLVRQGRGGCAPRRTHPARTRSWAACPASRHIRSQRSPGPPAATSYMPSSGPVVGKLAPVSSASEAAARAHSWPSLLVQTTPSHAGFSPSVMHPRPTATNPGPPAVTASTRPSGRPVTGCTSGPVPDPAHGSVAAGELRTCRWSARRRRCRCARCGWC